MKCEVVMYEENIVQRTVYILNFAVCRVHCAVKSKYGCCSRAENYWVYKLCDGKTIQNFLDKTFLLFYLVASKGLILFSFFFQ